MSTCIADVPTLNSINDRTSLGIRTQRHVYKSTLTGHMKTTYDVSARVRTSQINVGQVWGLVCLPSANNGGDIMTFLLVSLLS